MAKLIILRGNSGSGKTTIAKELQKKFGRTTMVISQDMVRREILKVNDGPMTEALPLLQELLIYGKKHSEITILEGIMYADWYKPAEEDLENAGNYIAYELKSIFMLGMFGNLGVKMRLFCYN